MSGIKAQPGRIFRDTDSYYQELHFRPASVARGLKCVNYGSQTASHIAFFTPSAPYPQVKVENGNNIRILNGLQGSVSSSIWMWATGSAQSGTLGFEVYNNSNFDRALFHTQQGGDWTWQSIRRDPSGGQPPVQTTLVWEHGQGAEFLRIIDNEGILMGTSSRMTGMSDINIQARSPALTTAALRLVFPFNFSSSRAIWTMHTSSTAGARAQIVVTTTTVAFQALSDYRMKTNIEPMTGATDIVKNLRPVRYHRIDDPDDAPLTDGFVAHEVQAVFPEAVFGEKDAMDRHNEPKLQSIDRHKFIPLLVSAVKELKNRLDQAETRAQTLN